MAVIVFVIKVNQYNMVLTVISPSKSQNVIKKTFLGKKCPFFRTGTLKRINDSLQSGHKRPQIYFTIIFRSFK